MPRSEEQEKAGTGDLHISCEEVIDLGRQQIEHQHRSLGGLELDSPTSAWEADEDRSELAASQAALEELERLATQLPATQGQELLEQARADERPFVQQLAHQIDELRKRL